SQELKTVSYHKLYDILKQDQHEVNEIRAKRIACTANPFALVAQQQPVYHPQNHPTHYTQNSSTRSQQAATRNRGKAIGNSPQPIYDQEPAMVSEDDEMSKDKEIDKFMALISLSFKKIYKPTNNNLRTSSNTKVLMIECVIHTVKTNMVIHIVKTEMMRLVVEIERVGKVADAFDKATESSDGLQPGQVDLNYVHALNEPHLHEIRIVPMLTTRLAYHPSLVLCIQSLRESLPAVPGAYAVSGVPGAETRVHIPAHSRSKAHNGLPDLILSNEPKPLV
nr:hypothetical protein [Tanacetum cinerariifolium]